MHENITATPLRLSICAGKVRSTALEAWSPTWDELKARLASPVIGAKDGPYFVRAEGTKRSDNTLAETGYVIILDGDSRIDPDSGEVFEGAPDPQLVHHALARLAVPHMIYSSHSNGKTEAEVIAHNAAEQQRHEKAIAEGKSSKLSPMDTGGAYGEHFHKWRCVIPCEHGKDALERLVGHLVGLLHAEGVMLADVSENTRWSQPWFLPRVPDEARLGAFRFLASEPGRWVAPEPAGEPAVEPHDIETVEAPGWESPIKVFNEQFTCGQVLESVGYTGNERAGWMRPGSSSGEPGVKLLPELSEQHGRQYVFSHGNDALNDGKAHDAFDCYRILRCDGDRNKALAWNPDLTKRNLEALAAAHYFAPDEKPITVGDAYSEAVGALNGIRAQSPFDPGALHDPKLIGWMAVVKHKDSANWARLEAVLRSMTTGPEVTVIRKAVEARNRERKAAVDKAKMAAAPALPTAYTYALSVHQGFAVYVGEDTGGMLPANVIAKRVPHYLRRLLAFDADIGMWYLFDGKRWALQDGAHGATGVFIDLLDLGGGLRAGYGTDYLSSVMKMTEASGLLPLPTFSQSSLPFLNGVLDMKTGLLAPTTPDNALSFVLPYAFDPLAVCPRIMAWLLAACDGDVELVHFLLCMAAAVLRRIMVKGQVFLTLVGKGGTGKSTFAKLLRALVGVENVLETSFERLANNRFEGAAIKDKLLVIISDADDWGGKVGMLKALTGGDTIPFERKNQNRSGKGANFIYGGSAVVLANKPVKTEDKTTGWLRRQRVVPFNKVFTDDDRIRWHVSGGDEANLLPEIPGLVNHLMTLSEADILAALMKPPAGVLSANLRASRANDTVTDWLICNCKPSKDSRARIGVKRETVVSIPASYPAQGTVTMRGFENSQTRLYPNYLTWCQQHDVKHPQSLNTFRGAIWTALERFGVPQACQTWGKDGRFADEQGAYIPGLALKDDDEPAHRDLFHTEENLPKFLE